MNDEPPRYRLGPRSTRGLIAGWRGGQILCVVVGSLVALGLLRSVGGLAGVFLAVLSGGLSLAVAAWPIGGRSAEEWVPTVIAFGAQVAAVKADAIAVSGASRPWGSGRSRYGPLSRLHLEQLDDTSVGAVVDDRGGTWTGVMVVGGGGFALLDEAERAAKVSAWSGVLAAAAHDGGGLHRLQWVARTVPAYLLGAPPELPAVSGESHGVARSYGDLLADVAQDLWAREVLVAVTVRGFRQRARWGSMGGPAAMLGRQLELVGERISSAGLSCGRPLSVSHLAQCLRRSIDVDPADDPVSWPWPLGIEEQWSRLRTDQSWHASYWVAEWPRSDVAPGWLLPLIMAGGIRHTVALTMAPLPPAIAQRRAERERTSGTADAELRRRHGFAMTARARREQDARLEREAELAQGHAGYRYSGYVTVTEADLGELERSCARVEQSAAISQVEIRRLYGAQEAAFCCTLPLGRGCAAR